MPDLSTQHTAVIFDVRLGQSQLGSLPRVQHTANKMKKAYLGGSFSLSAWLSFLTLLFHSPLGILSPKKSSP